MKKKVVVDQFDDIRILRYEVPAFAGLTYKKKMFVYYLSQAAIAGRDIIWDQNNCYNLQIRNVLENILVDYQGNKTNDEYTQFVIYTKKVLFANGIHHHYSSMKFTPHFSKEYFKMLLEETNQIGQYDELERIIFDPNYMTRRVVSDGNGDLVKASANNFYQNVTMQEALDFYAQKPQSDTPLSYGLNSTLQKRDGEIVEDVWCAEGKYAKEIRQIIANLQKAWTFACNEQQQKALDILMDYYQTGDLNLFDEYSIAWVREHTADIDYINGFIEVYGDAIAKRGSWEALIEIVDQDACVRTQKLSENAQWFEDHAPIDPRFRKSEVRGVVARVMQVAMLGGDSYPATPIGINLPNAEWIRERYGSKSVTLDNITYAYHLASLDSGVLNEFTCSEEERRIAREYGNLGGNLHTDLHECLGHGSGKMLPGISAADLKNYHSVLEEARADLFALYYIADPKMKDLGLVPSMDVAKSEYNSYLRNGLMVQLTRIKLGDNLEEAHMRNRQLIAAWVYEKGKSSNVVERKMVDGKTYIVINDYEALRGLFGQLLAEVQRIKSEGDFNAARTLVEDYGVKIDYQLHAEVLKRYEELHVPPFAGFVNPEYHLIEKEGKIVDVEISYTDDYLGQMLKYDNK